MKDFTVLVWKEGDAHVSLCPEASVSSYGDTEEETIRRHKEAMEFFLEDMSEAQIQDIVDSMPPADVSSVKISLS